MKKCLMMMLLVLLGVSCKSGGGDNILDEGSGVSLSKFDGVYRNCESDTDYAVSFSSTMNISGNSATEIMSYYDGLNCNASDMKESIQIQYNVTKSGSKYKFMLVAATSTIHDLSFLTPNYCGYTTSSWALNTPKDITGRDCDGVEFQYGSAISMGMSLSGTKLTITYSGGKVIYNKANGTNFSNPSPTFADGSYMFFNGAAGFYITFNGGNYSVRMYNANERKYYDEAGFYTVTGNQIEFDPQTVSNSCAPVEDPYTNLFATTTSTLALKDASQNVLIFNKADFSQGLFESEFLRASYTHACF